RPELAEHALRELGKPLGLEPGELANGIIRLVNANIISALKLVSVRRGYDPRDFVLVAAGGGGPMHAAALGAELQVKFIVVPPYSGVFSAWGMSLSEPRADAAQTRILLLTEGLADELTAVFGSLEREVRTALVAEGGDAASIRCERSADMRYRGQEHTVRVPIPAGTVSAAEIEAEFHGLHRQKYTFDLEGDAVEIVTCHVSAFGVRPPLPSAALAGPGSAVEQSPPPDQELRRNRGRDAAGVVPGHRVVGRRHADGGRVREVALCRRFDHESHGDRGTAGHGADAAHHNLLLGLRRARALRRARRPKPRVFGKGVGDGDAAGRLRTFVGGLDRVRERLTHVARRRPGLDDREVGGRR